MNDDDAQNQSEPEQEIAVSSRISADDDMEPLLSKIDSFVSDSGLNVSGFIGWASDEGDNAAEDRLDQIPEVKIDDEDS